VFSILAYLSDATVEERPPFQVRENRQGKETATTKGINVILRSKVLSLVRGGQVGNQVGRTKLVISEGLINCFSFGTNLAYNNQSRSYQFSVFPGIHAQDVGYTFFNGEATDGFGVPISASTAQLIQR